MASRRGRNYHGIKAHIESPHRKSPVKTGWRKRNKTKARARRLERESTLAVSE